MNPLKQLLQHGQSYWLDNLSRAMIADGSLARRVKEEGLRGITSNPEIFERAIAHSADYDGVIQKAVAQGLGPDALYESIVTRDVRDACDILRPVYDDSDGADGFVSLEVSPHAARNAERSIEEGRRLWRAVERPNLMIKIPGTAEGLAAIETLLHEGTNVNITLLFSVARYEAVAEAWLRALERRREAGEPINRLASVASFFLSRIDVLTDQLLDHRMDAEAGEEAGLAALKGKAAIANAKLAYQSYKKMVKGARWRALAKQGARPQRLLWASTGTKNPHYSDVMYVEALIGRDTVTTLPPATAAAFADHGKVEDTVEEGASEARHAMRAIEKAGIDFAAVTARLEDEAIQKFIDPFDALQRSLAEKRARFSAHRAAGPLENMALRLRRLVIRMTTEAGSGHPTSCMSCADIVSALYFHEMRWDPSDAEARNVDSFILSKGHAAPILWAVLYEAGAISDDPLSLRKLGSPLEGHPTPNCPWVKVATGSLGQGLAAANGIALANRLDGIDARIFCLMGDGECSEGSVWEAAQFASLNKLANLVAIVDVNGLGQSGDAPYHHDTAVFARRFEAFGWHAIEFDGHDMDAVLDALAATHKGGPTALIARTEKGKGVSFVEGKQGWHGKTLSRDEMAKALAELGEPAPATVPKPRRIGEFHPPQRKAVAPITLAYKPSDKFATREGYGHALALLGDAMPEIVAIDGDVKNSTFADAFGKGHPDRFFEGYIAEQDMVGAALGLAVSGRIPYVATFASFLTRAYDFIRMAAYSRPPHLVFCGSHSGVSVGEDGPSQMGLEDIAMFRALLGSTVFCPSDVVSAARLTETAALVDGIVYLRTARPKAPVLYANDEPFPVGGSKILHSSTVDAYTVIAAGVTVHEALAAYETLKKRDILLRVIDAYSIKPLDVETIAQAARETKGLIVVEDHWPEGGLGEAVSASIATGTPIRHLAVTGTPRSGTGEELLERHGISRHAIERAVLVMAA
jgi:transketolase